MRMLTSAPARKVTAGALAAAVTTLLIWWIKSANADLEIPGGVEAAVTTILTFAASYLTPPAKADQVFVRPERSVTRSPEPNLGSTHPVAPVARQVQPDSHGS